jgi:hypothetical protein
MIDSIIAPGVITLHATEVTTVALLEAMRAAQASAEPDQETGAVGAFSGSGAGIACSDIAMKRGVMLNEMKHLAVYQRSVSTELSWL